MDHKSARGPKKVRRRVKSPDGAGKKRSKSAKKTGVVGTKSKSTSIRARLGSKRPARLAAKPPRANEDGTSPAPANRPSKSIASPAVRRRASKTSKPGSRIASPGVKASRQKSPASATKRKGVRTKVKRKAVKNVAASKANGSDLSLATDTSTSTGTEIKPNLHIARSSISGISDPAWLDDERTRKGLSDDLNLLDGDSLPDDVKSITSEGDRHAEHSGREATNDGSSSFANGNGVAGRKRRPLTKSERRASRALMREAWAASDESDVPEKIGSRRKSSSADVDELRSLLEKERAQHAATKHSLKGLREMNEVMEAELAEWVNDAHAKTSDTSQKKYEEELLIHQTTRQKVLALEKRLRDESKSSKAKICAYRDERDTLKVSVVKLEGRLHAETEKRELAERELKDNKAATQLTVQRHQKALEVAKKQLEAECLVRASIEEKSSARIKEANSELEKLRTESSSLKQQLVESQNALSRLQVTSQEAESRASALEAELSLLKQQRQSELNTSANNLARANAERDAESLKVAELTARINQLSEQALKSEAPQQPKPSEQETATIPLKLPRTAESTPRGGASELSLDTVKGHEITAVLRRFEVADRAATKARRALYTVLKRHKEQVLTDSDDDLPYTDDESETPTPARTARTNRSEANSNVFTLDLTGLASDNAYSDEEKSGNASPALPPTHVAPSQPQIRKGHSRRGSQTMHGIAAYGISASAPSTPKHSQPSSGGPPRHTAEGSTEQPGMVRSFTLELFNKADENAFNQSILTPRPGVDSDAVGDRTSDAVGSMKQFKNSPQQQHRRTSSRILSDDERTRRRKNVMVRAEIVSSEQKYADCLQVLLQRYIRPLTEASKELNCRLDGDISRLFGHVGVIANFHQILLKDFGNAEAETVLLKNAAFLRMYNDYVSLYDLAVSQLHRITTSNRKVSEFLSKASSHEDCGGLSLTDLLIMPVQRIPRYELLLRELERYTDNGDTACPTLEKATKLIKSIAMTVNTRKRYGENLAHVLMLNKSLKDHIVALMKPHRFVERYDRLSLHKAMETSTLSEGLETAPAAQTVQAKDLKPFLVVLFNDMLLFTTDGSYRYTQTLSLDDVSLADEPKKLTGKAAALLGHSAKTVPFSELIVSSVGSRLCMFFESESQKDSWTKDLKQCLDRLAAQASKPSLGSEGMKARSNSEGAQPPLSARESPVRPRRAFSITGKLSKFF